jgi:BMFP domain-containing protein YqiC
MQTRSRVFDDLAKVAGGAVSTLGGIKAEIEVLIRQQIERLLVDADMVPRDEFDAVKTMAANARAGQEALAKRVGALERKLGLKASAKSPKKAKPRAKRTAKRKAKKKAG